MMDIGRWLKNEPKTLDKTLDTRGRLRSIGSPSDEGNLKISGKLDRFFASLYHFCGIDVSVLAPQLIT